MNNELTYTKAQDLKTGDSIYGNDGYEYTVKSVEVFGKNVFVTFQTPAGAISRWLNTVKLSKNSLVVTGVAPRLVGITQDGAKVYD